MTLNNKILFYFVLTLSTIMYYDKNYVKVMNTHYNFSKLISILDIDKIDEMIEDSLIVSNTNEEYEVVLLNENNYRFFINSNNVISKFNGYVVSVDKKNNKIQILDDNSNLYTIKDIKPSVNIYDNVYYSQVIGKTTKQNQDNINYYDIETDVNIFETTN